MTIHRGLCNRWHTACGQGWGGDCLSQHLCQWDPKFMEPWDQMLTESHPKSTSQYQSGSVIWRNPGKEIIYQPEGTTGLLGHPLRIGYHSQVCHFIGMSPGAPGGIWSTPCPEQGGGECRNTEKQGLRFHSYQPTLREAHLDSIRGASEESEEVQGSLRCGL